MGSRSFTHLLPTPRWANSGAARPLSWPWGSLPVLSHIPTGAGARNTSPPLSIHHGFFFSSMLGSSSASCLALLAHSYLDTQNAYCPFHSTGLTQRLPCVPVHTLQIINHFISHKALANTSLPLMSLYDRHWAHFSYQ